MIENNIQNEVKKSRRGLPRHTKNPFEPCQRQEHGGDSQ